MGNQRVKVVWFGGIARTAVDEPEGAESCPRRSGRGGCGYRTPGHQRTVFTHVRPCEQKTASGGHQDERSDLQRRWAHLEQSDVQRHDQWFVQERVGLAHTAGRPGSRVPDRQSRRPYQHGRGVQGLQAVNTMEFVVRALRGWVVPLVIPIPEAWKAFDGRGLEKELQLVNSCTPWGGR